MPFATQQLSSGLTNTPVAKGLPVGLRRVTALVSAALACAHLVGCAALTNPVANGVPVHMVPNELLAPSKEGFDRVDLTLLRQTPPKQYLLAPGDTLGVYIEGIIGRPETPPPVSVPDSPDMPPAIGYPFPIRADGTISLPFMGEVQVAGLTIEQAEQKVIGAYLKKEIVREENYRIIVSLFRPRYESVLVVRDDGGQSKVSVTNSGLIGFDSQTTISGGRSATGQAVELPAYENDLLNALARTGGLPGPEAVQEIVIYRGSRRDSEGQGPQGDSPPNPFVHGDKDDQTVVRIPLQVPTGQPLRLKRSDILLHTGDIVEVRAREPELFYTGGLIPAGEFALPYDRDITVVEALLRTRAPVLSGGLSTSNLNGSIVGAGIGNPSPSLLSVIRRTPTGSQVIIRIDLNEALRDPRQNILVQAEDVLILQENTDEALTRYFTNAYQMDFFFRYLNRTDATGTGSIVVP
jgi:protein involved in polysaccharide export with SLBB domain